ncbi:uncharacterized protein LAESUDRAFT_761913 [Laetiporus sulphureus 93-53]|uniref:Uncharacterized protein n=1 Tax=Laetiporus sulphureus 93-53 TaxID=1314785 RepID=A0A165CWG4_9APHY|nr:uncharacterized protein LAESUDRAFT_761913 [Laetiporus sulphureus 93-53]KZT03582.1 hypothetical protein LAESUDRAFT_761913 [Laetiporus sulphureus 93-53]
MTKSGECGSKRSATEQSIHPSYSRRQPFTSSTTEDEEVASEANVPSEPNAESQENVPSQPATRSPSSGDGQSLQVRAADRWPLRVAEWLSATGDRCRPNSSLVLVPLSLIDTGLRECSNMGGEIWSSWTEYQGANWWHRYQWQWTRRWCQLSRSFLIVFVRGDGSNLFARSYNTDIDMFMTHAIGTVKICNPAAPGYTHMVQPLPLAYPPSEQTASFGAATWRFGQPNFEMSMNNSTTDETVGRPSKWLRYDTTEPGGPSAEYYTLGPSALSRSEYNPPLLPNDLDFSNLDPDLLAELPIGMNAQFMSLQAHDSFAPSSSDEENAFMVPLPDPVAGPSRSHMTWNFPSFENIPAASQSPIAAVLPPDLFFFPAAAYTAAVAGSSQPSHASPDPEIPPHGGYPNSNPVPSPQQTFVSHPDMSDGANNSRHQAPPQHSNDEANPRDAGENDA